MIKNLLAPLVIVIAVFSFGSCSKERVVLDYKSGDVYQNYVPLEIGKYILYDVDSSIWDDFSCTKLVRKSQHKYEVVDTFRDNQKRLSYVINIFSRSNDKAAFIIDDVIYVTPGAEQLEKVQKNLIYTPLSNPVKENNRFDGHARIPDQDPDLNYLLDWEYRYMNVGKSFNNDYKTYDNTVTVKEVDRVLNNPESQPNAYAELLQSKAVYAYGLGMIYKEYVYWTYDPIPGQTNCRKGVGVVMRALEHN